MKPRDWLALAAWLALSLVAGEVLVRLLLPPPGLFVFPAADFGVMMADSARGYVYAPHLRRHIETPDYRIDFATNAQGMRDSPIDSGPPPRLRILAVGDSYTQGLGVQAGEAWPKRFEAGIAGSRVYNAGVSGYGVQQMGVTAHQVVPQLHPHILLVGVYSQGYYRINDPFVVVSGSASPIARSRSRYVKVVPGGVLLPAFDNPLAREITLWVDQHSYLAGHVLHLAARAWEALRSLGRDAAPGPPVGDELRRAMLPMLEELLRLRQYADSAHVPLVALLINPQEADGAIAPAQWMYNRIITDFAVDHDLCVVDPLPELQTAAAGRPVLRFAGDPHWSPRAHELAAGILLRELLGPAGTRSACRKARAALSSGKVN